MRTPATAGFAKGAKFRSVNAKFRTAGAGLALIYFAARILTPQTGL
jgi:hypothetical protein